MLKGLICIDRHEMLTLWKSDVSLVFSFCLPIATVEGAVDRLDRRRFVVLKAMLRIWVSNFGQWSKTHDNSSIGQSKSNASTLSSSAPGARMTPPPPPVGRGPPRPSPPSPNPHQQQSTSILTSAPQLQFVVHPLPGSQEQLFDKLRYGGVQ